MKNFRLENPSLLFLLVSPKIILDKQRVLGLCVTYVHNN